MPSLRCDSVEGDRIDKEPQQIEARRQELLKQHADLEIRFTVDDQNISIHGPGFDLVHGITLGPEDFVRSPTAIANFASQYASEGDAPCEWAERLYNIDWWTPMGRGEHFATTEEPVAVARDIASVFHRFDLGDKGEYAYVNLTGSMHGKSRRIFVQLRYLISIKLRCA